MLQIDERVLDYIIHRLLNIVTILKMTEDECSQGVKEVIHGCETQLLAMREKIVKSIEDDD